MFYLTKLLELLRNLPRLWIVLRENVSLNVTEFKKCAECFTWQSYLNCCGIYQVCGLFCVKKFLEMSRNLPSLRNVLHAKVTWNIVEFTKFVECFTCKSCLNFYRIKKVYRNFAQKNCLNCCSIYKDYGLFCLEKLPKLQSLASKILTFAQTKLKII